MDCNHPPRVLLDASVLRRGHFAVGAIKTKRLKWAGTELVSEIRGFTKRREDTRQWEREQIRCIPTIARLARDGAIEAYESLEIRLQLAKGYNEPGLGNVFCDVPLKEAQSPVSRGRLIAGDAEKTFGRQGLLYVYRNLRDLKPKQARALLEAPELNFDEFEKESLRSIEVFHSITSKQDAHFDDSWHLWTAERNGLDFYCTLDTKIC